MPLLLQMLALHHWNAFAVLSVSVRVSVYIIQAQTSEGEFQLLQLADIDMIYLAYFLFFVARCCHAAHPLNLPCKRTIIWLPVVSLAVVRCTPDIYRCELFLQERERDTD